MGKKIIALGLFLGFCLGCVTAGTSVRQGHELYSMTDQEKFPNNVGVQDNLVFNPADVEAALPAMSDLPLPAPLKKNKKSRLYTGVIRNKTKYEVSVPDGNSGATLVIPAKSWIEYSAWSQHFDLTAYRDGKPFYCMNIFAKPKSHPFGCKKYDFYIEIVKGQPIHKKKFRRKKRPGGVEALG